MSTLGGLIRYCANKRPKKDWIPKEQWMKKHGYGKYASTQESEKRDKYK